MAMYFLLTRLAPDAWEHAYAYETLEHQVADCVRVHCPELTWIATFAMRGRESYLDIVEAPYGDAALRLAVLIRNHGLSRVELHLAATSEFLLEEATTRAAASPRTVPRAPTRGFERAALL